MSKNDEDADLEVGMTTAERRRRRRRGAGLRVPSDNVPRARTPTGAPPPPVPEDPALAMSIAYSFTSDASGPVPRNIANEPSAPIAPEAVPTVIDPPTASSGGGEDFEMNTREMSAVDLEALGLSESSATVPFQRISSPRIDKTEIEVDVTLDEPPEATAPDFHTKKTTQMAVVTPEALERAEHAAERAKTTQMAAVPDASPTPGPRHPTVALSEDDIEVVRAATQAGRTRAPTAPPVTPSATPPPAPRTKTPTGAPPLVAPAPQAPPPAQPPPAAQAAPAPQPASTPQPAPSPSASAPSPVRNLDANKTMPLQAIDVEVLSKSPASDEPMSVPDIDIQELAERAESSGEIEVDVDAEEPPETLTAAVAAAAAPATGSPRSMPRAQSVPPPAPPEKRTSGAVDVQHAPDKPDKPIAPAVAAPTPAPPPPPAAAKPPAPPPAKKPVPQAAVAAVVTKEPSRPNATKQRQWFMDLFDEDYLRTLPFLTPQATQAEAEFVINAMTLAPGAQVLDLGCGYGRHAMELAARGFHVVGLDLSTPLLVRGGEEAHRRGLTINFVRGDMRELDFEKQFDACYCLFSTFGYFDDETNKKTLQNVARALKPGGKVLVEILNRDYVIADLPTRVWWEGDGCVVLEEVELNYFSSRIQVNRSVVFDDGRQLEQEISVRAYSLHEVGKLMHAAGFRVLEVSGGYQMRGRFLGNQSRHIIVLAERKDT